MKVVLLFLGSSLLSYFLVIFFKRFAIKANVIDRPREDRFHQDTTPLMGGNAIYFSFLAWVMIRGIISWQLGSFLAIGVIGLLYGIARHRNKLTLFFAMSVIWCTVWGLIWGGTSDNRLAGLMLGGTMMVLVGNMDDTSGGIVPFVKLIGQGVAGFFLIYFGIKVEFFTDVAFLSGMHWLNYMSYPFTLFWIIGMTNAFNLIDNMNGLSSGVAVISSLFFGLISLVIGQIELAQLLFIFLGAGLGFLPHNFPKARIFMGDSGSMFIGFVIASISIIGSWSTATSSLKMSLAIPILVLVYPIFDTTLVTLTRIIRGRPISLGGKDHSSHRLVRLGLQGPDAVLLIYSFCTLAGFCGLFLTIIHYEQALFMLTFISLFIILVGLRLSRIDIE